MKVFRILGFLAALLPSLAFAQPAMVETPSLAERVAAGTLPPVAQRIPQHPRVTDPTAKIGRAHV